MLQALPDNARSGNPDDSGHMFEKFNRCVSLALYDLVMIAHLFASARTTVPMSMLLEVE